MTQMFTQSDLPLATQTITVDLELDHGVIVQRKIVEGTRVPPDLIDAYHQATGEKPAKDDEASSRYDSMKVEDLEQLVSDRELQVEGTGKDGNIVKADLIRALEAGE